MATDQMTQDIYEVEDEVAEDTSGVARAGHRAGRAAVAVMDQVPHVVRAVRSSLDDIGAHIPDAASAARTGAVATTESFRSMPQPTLNLIGALSVGVGIGLFVAGAPRVVTLTALTPAILAGVATTLEEGSKRTTHH